MMDQSSACSISKRVPFCAVYTSIVFYIHLLTRCVSFLCRIVGA